MEEKTKIVVADDHLLIIELFVNEISRSDNYEVVGYALNSDQLLEVLSKQTADILLLDINMPRVDGLTMLPIVKGLYPNLKVIMLTNFADGSLVKEAIQKGVSGFVSKSADLSELRSSIASVVKGETYFCKISYNNLISNISNSKKNNTQETNNNHNSFKRLAPQENIQSGYIIDKQETLLRYEALTQREKEILEYIVKGKTTKDISEDLYISSRTVETHRKNILQKIGVKSTLNLIKLMLEHEIVSHNVVTNN